MKPTIVTLNLFQGPWSSAAPVEEWMLKQVQQDDWVSN